MHLSTSKVRSQDQVDSLREKNRDNEYCLQWFLFSELKFAAYMCLGTHLTACGWFLLACSSLSIGTVDPHVCNVGSWALHISETPLSKRQWHYNIIPYSCICLGCLCFYGSKFTLLGGEISKSSLAGTDCSLILDRLQWSIH